MKINKFEIPGEASTHTKILAERGDADRVAKSLHDEAEYYEQEGYPITAGRMREAAKVIEDREEKIRGLLDLGVRLETEEDRENFELFNALPDELKMALRMSRPCIVPDCDKPQVAKGYCSTCYKQWKRTGSPQRKAKRGCQTPGCRRKHHAQGYCHTCYTRQQRETR